MHRSTVVVCFWKFRFCFLAFVIGICIAPHHSVWAQPRASISCFLVVFACTLHIDRRMCISTVLIRSRQYSIINFKSPSTFNQLHSKISGCFFFFWSIAVIGNPLVQTHSADPFLSPCNGSPCTDQSMTRAPTSITSLLKAEQKWWGVASWLTCYTWVYDV